MKIDPAMIVFSEDFEAPLPQIANRWSAASVSLASLSSDVRPGSSGTSSLRMGGAGSGSNLYRLLPADYSLLYVRFYAKYGAASGYHHTGGMLGGYQPRSEYPLGDAGLRGLRDNGDRLISIQFEPYAGTGRLDFYMNWIDMPGVDYMGNYYGRTTLETEKPSVAATQWRCVEYMVKLNQEATGHDGELALWIDGKLIQHLRPGSPLGSWNTVGNWISGPDGQPFGGMRWRDVTTYGLNWVKLQNYDATPDVWFDDVIVATSRIGC